MNHGDDKSPRFVIKYHSRYVLAQNEGTRIHFFTVLQHRFDDVFLVNAACTECWLTLEPSSLGSRCDLVPYEPWMVPTYHTWMQARLKTVKNQGITVNAERSSEPNRNT